MLASNQGFEVCGREGGGVDKFMCGVPDDMAYQDEAEMEYTQFPLLGARNFTISMCPFKAAR